MHNVRLSLGNLALFARCCHASVSLAPTVGRFGRERAAGAVGLGRDFTRLWAAYAISTIGSAVATGAFALIAVLVLASSALQVSLLSALGGAVGAVLALPLGPWIEFRHKRPVMIAADVGRFLVLLTIPVAYAMHGLTYTHLAVVSVLVAMGQVAFLGASGPHLRALVVPDRLTEANGRFESVQWTSSAVGPPAGGLLMSALGPCVTVIVDAFSYLLSAVGVPCVAGVVGARLSRRFAQGKAPRAALTAPRLALGAGAALLLLSVASLPWTAPLDEPSLQREDTPTRQVY